jgi:RNA polymerase sigma-70 factor (ECF subfamily)
MIKEGNDYLNRSAFGTTVSHYHIEAAIAFEHCIADNFNETNWNRILELYEWLCKITPSPISEMNKAVAIMQVSGAKNALHSLEKIADKKKLESFYLYHSLLGELNWQLNNFVQAKLNFEKAISLSKSNTETKMLKEKIAALVN